MSNGMKEFPPLAAGLNGKVEFHEFIDLIDKLETVEKQDKEGKNLMLEYWKFMS